VAKQPGAQMRGNLRASLAGALLATCLSAQALPPRAPALFEVLPVAPPLPLPQQALPGRAHAVTIDRTALAADRLRITLPGDLSYEAIGRARGGDGDRTTWVGHAGDNPRDTVVMGSSGGAVAGSFVYRNRLYKLEPRADGSHVLSEVAPSAPAPELEPLAVDADGPPAAVAAGPGSQFIDVLVAYTPAVQAIYGSAGSEALAVQAVAETNQAYANSNMATRLHLAGTYLVDYLEAQHMPTDLARLRSSGDGFMDELHGVRDGAGADLVVLLANDPQYCGLAYRMNSLSAGFAAWAFSVVHHGCATGYYSFGHEIGHNQGAHHDLANATGAALYPYAYGYQNPLGVFRTIMALECPLPCPRLPYFSGVDHLVLGLPSGITGSAENALAIDQTAPVVAAFRDSVTLPPGC